MARDRTPPAAARAAAPPAVDRAAAPRAGAGGGARERWLPVLAILALAWLTYANHLGNELVLDDKAWLPRLPAVRDPFDLGAIFGGRFFGEFRRADTLWRPLLTWSLALNWRLNELVGLAGASAPLYRAVDVLLHAGAACALHAFLRSAGLARGTALLAALVFVAHPLQSEAVLSIVNRSEALAAGAGFAFLALHRQGRSAAAACALGAALLSKESAVAFALVAPWSDAALGRAPGAPIVSGARVLSGARLLRPHALYALVVVGWLVVRARVVGGSELAVPFVDNPLVVEGLGVRLLTACAAQLRYLELLVFPLRLSSDYGYDAFPVARDLADARVVGALAIALGGLALSVLAWRRAPFLAFAPLAWVLLFGPASNVVLPIGTILAERLAYAPLGIAAGALAAGAAWLARGRLAPRASAALAGLVLAAAVLRTAARNRSWADEPVFYAAAVALAPRSAVAQHNLALHLVERGELARAIAGERAALAIAPDFHRARSTLGIALVESGRLAEALVEFETIVAREPRFTDGQFGLGQTLQLLRRPAEARAAYERTLALDARYLPARVKLAELRAQAGDLAGARAELARALAQQPDYAPALARLRQLEAAR